MSHPTKPHSVLQDYTVTIYRRALHPELFSLKQRRVIRGPGVEMEAWIMPGAHLVRAIHREECVCELITDRSDNLPTKGALTNYPCAGERDFEHAFDCGLEYNSTVQTESLNPNLYSATYDEIVELSREMEALEHRWTDADGGRCLTVLDFVRHGREYHAESYHLIAQGGVVIRSQTVFRIPNGR